MNLDKPWAFATAHSIGHVYSEKQTEYKIWEITNAIDICSQQIMGWGFYMLEQTACFGLARFFPIYMQHEYFLHYYFITMLPRCYHSDWNLYSLFHKGIYYILGKTTKTQ